jgi:S-adenosylmethionine:tRNA ribosyltransferase-isomerase
MDVSLFDFELPEERIALRPASPRDSARLMVVHQGGKIEHRKIRDLPDYFARGDVLVVNDTRVIAARLHGMRLRDGAAAKIEILLHRRLSPDSWSVLARPARKLAAGDALAFAGLKAQVTARGEGGECQIRFALSGAALDAAIEAQGETPLPPYIAGKRRPDAQDRADYQTLFARETGSVAAPTAGLHFTPELLARIAAKGVEREKVTLHVGLGTFLPVTADDTADHRMHSEHATLTAEAAARLNAAHDAGRRIVAIGTTSLRTLESAADKGGRLRALDDETDIFITPGYRFRAVDRLLTNLHLPRSTLFMLVSAFMGLEVMKAAYSEAIREGYRFYSYGDGCLLLGPGGGRP